MTVLLQLLQVLAYRTAPELRITPVNRLFTRHTTTTVCIGLHDAGIDRKAFAPHQPLGHATALHVLKQLSKQVALTESTMAVLREGGVIRNFLFESHPTEPA